MKRNLYLTCFILCLALTLASCERLWYFDIVDSSDIEHPVLCLSMKPHCSGEAVDLAILRFDEIEKSGKVVRPVWVIQTESNNPLHIIKFGKAPEGWTTVKPAISLESEKYYRVEDHIFTCRLAKPHNICTVID